MFAMPAAISIAAISIASNWEYFHSIELGQNEGPSKESFNSVARALSKTVVLLRIPCLSLLHGMYVFTMD
jgi:hypothetical protein